MKYVQLKLVVEYSMSDGVWDNYDEDSFFNPEDWDDRSEEEVIHEAMNGAYTFLMSPRWVTLRRLGVPPKTQVAIVDTLIKYFVSFEEYEKCADLVKVQDKIKLRYLVGVLDNPSSVSSVSGSDKSKSDKDV